ncbi:hypothetical protein CLU79DRAFT_888835 [Phycomyces nitens]|nr:hypothetical protein CLU79DRAFT_888835 [Phycomyces nitens]
MFVDSNMPITKWPIENRGEPPFRTMNHYMVCWATRSRVSELPFTAVKAGHDALCWSRYPPLFITPTVWNSGGLKNMDVIRLCWFRCQWDRVGDRSFFGRVSELPFTAVKAGHDASVGSDIRLSLSHQLSGILGGRPVSFLAGESLHGLLGYSVEVIIFQWPALKRQEFLSSHSRRSRLVMMRLLVPMSASLYQTNCLEFRWTQEHGCDSVVLVSVASGIGWATGQFFGRVSALPFTVVKAGHDALCWFRYPPLFITPTVWNSGGLKNMDVIRLCWFRCQWDRVGDRSVFGRVSELPFTAVKAGHDALCWFRYPPLFITPTVWNSGGLKNMDVIRLCWFRCQWDRVGDRVSELPFTAVKAGHDASVGPDVRLSLSNQLSGIPGGRPVSFLAGELLHGLLGYSVEVNIFRWLALKRQEFLRSHLRWSRLVMMRSVGSDIRLSLSHQLSGIPGGRPVSFLAGESLHGLLGYSIEVNIFQWPAPKRQEFLSSHSRRLRLVKMRLLGGRPVSFLAGESLHGLLGYSVEVIIFQWPALKRQEFLSSHSRRSRLVMMRLLVPMSASLYQTNCLESWWTQEHGCDSVVLVSVARGIGWATGQFFGRVSELPFTAVKAGHDASVGPDVRLSLSNQLSGIPGGRPVSFLAGELLHGLLGYSVEVNIFRWLTLKRQEFLRSHLRWSRLVMMRLLVPMYASLYQTNCLESWWTQEHGCDSVVLVSVASGIGWATDRF